MKRVFFSCLPGLERLLEQQLKPANIKVLTGGCEVSWLGTDGNQVYPSVASHCLERVGAFHSRFFDEFERGLERLCLRELLDGKRVSLCVRSSKSRLYHEGALRERVLNHCPLFVSENADWRLLVRLFRDWCEISLEKEPPLHRRGYRLEGGKAPLREDLASALVLASANTKDFSLLVDPFCGSGTIVIEAALMMKRANSKSVKLVGGDRDRG